MAQLYIRSFTLYRPQEESEVPALEYLPPIFKRRLGQLCRMTIQVVHDALEQNPQLKKERTKLLFGSFRGELGQEFKVNRQFATEQVVMPAAFTLSVYNAAIAEATIAFGLTGGYAAVYPQEGDFYSALAAAAAPVLCGDEQEILFVFGDERITPQYKDVALYGRPSTDKKPFAFAALLSAGPDGTPLELSDWQGKSAEAFISANARAGA